MGTRVGVLPASAKARPKTLILAAAFASLVLSVSLWFGGDRDKGVFVGLWVPSICAAGALVLGGGRRD